MPVHWISALLSLVLLVACAPTLDWREVRPDATGLALWLPCKPASHARELMVAGRKVTLTLHACNAGGVTWALAHADMRDPATIGAALRALRAAAAQNVGAPSSTSLRPLPISGQTPQAESGLIELAGRLPDGSAIRAQVAVFSRGTQVFQATAMGAHLDAEAAQTFLSSIRWPS